MITDDISAVNWLDVHVQFLIVEIPEILEIFLLLYFSFTILIEGRHERINELLPILPSHATYSLHYYSGDLVPFKLTFPMKTLIN